MKQHPAAGNRGNGVGAASGNAAGRDRFDRLQHGRSVAAGARPLSRRGSDRASQCRRACSAGAGTRRAVCRRRRSRCYGELKAELSGSGIEAAAGDDAVVEAAQRPADWVMAAITGAAGLRPTWPPLSAALPSRSPTRNAWSAPARCSCAGRAAAGATVLPVDSEHNAIFQALGAAAARMCAVSS